MRRRRQSKCELMKTGELREWKHWSLAYAKWKRKRKRPPTGKRAMRGELRSAKHAADREALRFELKQAEGNEG